MFASHRSQSSRIFPTPITLLNPENTSNTTFENIKSLYIDTKLASFGEKRDDKPNLPEAKVVKRTGPNSEASIFSPTCYLDEVHQDKVSFFLRFIFPYISIKQQKG